MRFLLDTYTQALLQNSKYSRVLEEISSNSMETDCSFVTVVGDRIFEKDCRIGVFEQCVCSISRIELVRRTLGLGFTYLRHALLLGEMTDASALDVTWSLAKFGSRIPMALRSRLERLVDIDTDIVRSSAFNYWKNEDWNIKDLSCAWTERSTFERGDVLLLTGASWVNVDPAGLARKYSLNGIPVVYFLYDLLPLDNPSVMQVADFVRYENFIVNMGRSADMIITPSEEVARKLEYFLAGKQLKNDRIISCSLRKAALKPRPGAPSLRFQRLGLIDEPFMLCVSDLTSRKHLVWLYDLCIELRRKRPDAPRLVIAGRTHNDISQAQVLRRAPDWGKAAIFIADPTDEELAWLLSKARVFLDPSFGGGLAMSLTDAVNFGAPCIAANAPSLIEASGGRAVHLSKDVSSWMTSIMDALDGRQVPPTPTCDAPPIARMLREHLCGLRGA